MTRIALSDSESAASHAAKVSDRALSGPRLGAPLGVRAVAELIGCSPWTVRQKLVTSGLPHLRFGANGKLVFYENQIIEWIVRQTHSRGGQQL
jgi:hypothetical protein